jgi:hypothetical protein
MFQFQQQFDFVPEVTSPAAPHRTVRRHRGSGSSPRFSLPQQELTLT